MSQENVEIVRQAAEIWNRGDLDAFLESYDEEVVIRAAEGWPETAYHGRWRVPRNGRKCGHIGRTPTA